MKRSRAEASAEPEFVYTGVSSLMANKNYIYRGLAVGEMEQILRYRKIRPKCDPCTETDIRIANSTPTTDKNKTTYPKCCLFTAEQHVRTGDYDTSYVSFSKKAELIFDWQTAPGKGGSGIIAVVDITGLDIIDTARLDWGEKFSSPEVYAKAVLEVLVKGSIPATSIVAFLRVKTVPIDERNDYETKLTRLTNMVYPVIKAHGIVKIVKKKIFTNAAQLLTDKISRRNADYKAAKIPIPKGSIRYPPETVFYCVEQMTGIDIGTSFELPSNYVFYSPGSTLDLKDTVLPGLSRTLSTVPAQHDTRSPNGAENTNVAENTNGAEDTNVAEDTKSGMGGKRTRKSFCDYLPHMKKVYKRQTKKLIKRYPGMVNTKINRKKTKKN
jgi:hypothetical protein